LPAHRGERSVPVPGSTGDQDRDRRTGFRRDDRGRRPRTRLGAFDTPSFAAYGRDLLCPVLEPGQVVVLDNLSAHKSAAVREAIAAAGCTVLFLPPYSPDFAPIELAWAQIKAALRTAAARTQDALDAAIAAAWRRVTPDHARAYFRYCGYPLAQLHGQPL
jgi:transposase